MAPTMPSIIPEVQSRRPGGHAPPKRGRATPKWGRSADTPREGQLCSLAPGKIHGSAVTVLRVLAETHVDITTSSGSSAFKALMAVGTGPSGSRLPLPQLSFDSGIPKRTTPGTPIRRPLRLLDRGVRRPLELAGH
jgi:hypothetical protein